MDQRSRQIARSFGPLLDQMRQLGSAPVLEGLQGLRKPIPVPDGARFEQRTYSNAAGSRTYKLFVPSGYVGQTVRLLVMLQTIA
jgi:hypothetical protein